MKKTVLLLISLIFSTSIFAKTYYFDPDYMKMPSRLGNLGMGAAAGVVVPFVTVGTVTGGLTFYVLAKGSKAIRNSQSSGNEYQQAANFLFDLGSGLVEGLLVAIPSVAVGALSVGAMLPVELVIAPITGLVGAGAGLALTAYNEGVRQFATCHVSDETLAKAKQSIIDFDESHKRAADDVYGYSYDEEKARRYDVAKDILAKDECLNKIGLNSNERFQLIKYQISSREHLVKSGFLAYCYPPMIDLPGFFK